MVDLTLAARRRWTSSPSGTPRRRRARAAPTDGRAADADLRCATRPSDFRTRACLQALHVTAHIAQLPEPVRRRARARATTQPTTQSTSASSAQFARTLQGSAVATTRRSGGRATAPRRRQRTRRALGADLFDGAGAMLGGIAEAARRRGQGIESHNPKDDQHPAGARGLMQIVPGHRNRLGVSDGSMFDPPAGPSRCATASCSPAISRS